MRLALLFFAVTSLLSCGPEPVNPGREVRERYWHIRERLLDRHLVNGVVVSLASPDQPPPNNRDALLHTSLTLASLPCSDRPALLAGIAALEIEPGRYIRYFDYPKKDQISRDMIVGLVFGLAQTYRQCPRLRGEIRSRVTRLKRYVENHDDSLGVGPASQLSGPSRAAVDFAAQIVGAGNGPSFADKAALAAQATMLPIGVLSRGAEFFAVHLTSLEIMLWTWAENWTPDLEAVQRGFCGVTGEFGNPLYDGLCGRASSVRKALQSWEYSCLEYRWQEPEPLGVCDPAGVHHPGHDFLVLYGLFVREGLVSFFQPTIEGEELAGDAAAKFRAAF